MPTDSPDVTPSPAPPIVEHPAPPFELPEYQSAFLDFYRNASELLARAKDPLLRQLRRRRPTRNYRGRNTMPEGKVHESSLMLVKSEVSVTAKEILGGDPAVLGKKLDLLTDEYLASLMPQIFGSISAATAAVGNSLDAGGKPLSADLLLEMFELTLSFNFSRLSG
jgi:hypothetical protein